MAKSSYQAADIEVLEGLEPVRARPGMFIAGTDTAEGLHQLVSEIVDNSIDEAMNGHASKVEVILHADGQSVTVSDDGRGIPVERHPKFKKSTLELILTTLHAGGKFSAKNYQTAGGLHGVGSSVVNALSEELIAWVIRDGKEYCQKYARGKPISQVRPTKRKVRGSGTTIFFRPDIEIFSKIDFEAPRIRNLLRTKAFLNPGLCCVFKNEADDSNDQFCFERGLGAYLEQLLVERKAKPVGETPFHIVRDEEVKIEIALAWTESTREELKSFANGIPTPDGGSHADGARSGIVKAIRNYISVHELMPKGLKLGAEDIREGLLCLVSIRVPSSKMQAQFQGQTKSRLNNPELVSVVDAAARGLEQMLNQKPSAADAIVQRVVLAAKARAASRAASQNIRRKVGVSHRLTLPGKLADCSSTQPAKCELFIVEGDSAGGSAKQGRDRSSQAVLPLRGKVINAISASQKKVFDNKELSNIVSALGCGVADNVKPEKIRYGKVIILTDADADGMHIATLLMAFFFRFLRPLVEEGYVYLGKPPLYGVRNAKPRTETNGKRPKKKAAKPDVLWAYSDEELLALRAKYDFESARITRYKGLGEMNPSTLWETTLDPENRTLLRVTFEAEEFVTEQLNTLMGQDPQGRFQLIQDSAATVELDI